MAVTKHTEVFNPVRPVFVKHPEGLKIKGVLYKKKDELPWYEQDMDEDRIRVLYYEGFIHHNSDLEKEGHVGDRLQEFNKAMLDTLYNLLNAEVKKRASNTSEYNQKKVKYSKAEDKQRGLIKRWLNNNKWAADEFVKFRDQILKQEA